MTRCTTAGLPVRVTAANTNVERGAAHSIRFEKANVYSPFWLGGETDLHPDALPTRQLDSLPSLLACSV